MLAFGFGFWSEWELQEKVDFDGVNKLITVYPTITNLDIREDVWSAWVRWDAILNRNYNRFEPAMERTGLDAIPGSEPTGDFYFLVNGWKLVIDLTKVAVTGVLYSRDFLTAYYDSDLNPQYPVKVSSIVNVVSTPTNVVTGDINEVPALVWDANEVDHDVEGTFGAEVGHLKHTEHLVYLDGELTPVGDGSQHNPFNDLSVCIDFCENHGIRKITPYSEMIIDRKIKNFTISGIGTPAVKTNSQNLDKSVFDHVSLSGEYLGSITAQDCELISINNPTTLNGNFGNCSLGSEFEVPNNGVALIKHCSSFVEGFVPPSISVGGATGTGRIQIMAHTGGVTITDCNQPTDDVKITIVGSVTVDSSCIDGNIVVIGTVKPIDNSGAGCNVQWIIMNPEEISNIPSNVWSYTR